MRRRYGLIALIVLCCSSLILGWTRGSYSGWFLFYSMSVIAAYSELVQLLCLKKVEVQREISNPNFLADETAVVTLKVTQHSWLPLPWMILEDEWFQTGKQQAFVHRKWFFPWFKSIFVCQYKIPNVQRGKYEFRRLSLFTGDMFGLAIKKGEAEAISYFIVHPKPLKVRRWSEANRNYGGETIIDAELIEDASQVSGVRDYVQGDPMNRIHWRTTSRLNILKTKEMESTGTKQMMIFLDAAGSSYIMNPSLGIFETCTQAAAGLLKHGKENNFHLGFVSNCADYFSIPLSRPFDLQQGYDFLAAVAQDGRLSFHDTLCQEAELLPAGALVVCITANLNEQLARAALQLRIRKLKVKILFVHDSAAISWQDLQIKQQLQALGCGCHELKSSLVKWQAQGGIQYAGA